MGGGGRSFLDGIFLLFLRWVWRKVGKGNGMYLECE